MVYIRPNLALKTTCGRKQLFYILYLFMTKLTKDKAIAEAIKYCKVQGKDIESTIKYIEETIPWAIPTGKEGDTLLDSKYIRQVMLDFNILSYKY